MVFRKVEPKAEPVKEKKEIVIDTEPKDVKTNYKGEGDAITTSPKIG